ncbi:hypothetical protein FHP05_02765 [Cerasibacillus terrae]|uniref:Uncharacterized protein n=1 Tax=Cerasibacillus terrae TaxID=2498845 RepID=A0A5C8P2Z1_9BACI|nr:YqhG family protein [Cerasibacillus terrae]TXL67961.1 hypothetical protein FHP05_02765 [Cerasibacillus terrae]
MALSNLNQFLKTFFTTHECRILSREEGVFTVQLTEEMDKALMNRPFYWHYMKKMGKTGDPMQLTFITNSEKREYKGEWIHFGSPRLQQIIHHLKEKERYTKLYQKDISAQNKALYPWLVTNIKISYIGKQMKEELFSIGLNLVNGMMRTKMMDLLKNISLQMTIPDYCYSISPIIMPKSGYKRIENVLKQYIQDQNHQWAEESLRTLDSELKLLHHFYKDNQDENEEQLLKEEMDLKNRYQPTIKLQVVNGGIFYLSKSLT